jgi:outer membrane receptor protein involved in Fe transport
LTADAFVGYPINSRWDAQLNLSNLTNERYIVQVAARGLVQSSDEFRAKLTLTYKW